MKQRCLLAVIFAVAVLFCAAFGAENVKLPYAAGERFIVTAGYDTPPTHVDKDSYAIDLTQDGCSAYAKPALAALSGTAWVVEESGYNGGYGTQLLVMSRDNVVERYAHLVPGSISVDEGGAILQGMIVGEIGDTGLVAGIACAEHPGTHIHFAMDTKNADGSFVARDPEPISGYTDIAAGRWYVSDNIPVAVTGSLADLIEILKGLIGGGATKAQPEASSVVQLSAQSTGLSAPEPQRVLSTISGASLPATSVSLPKNSTSQPAVGVSGGAPSIEAATSSIPLAQPGGGSNPSVGVSATTLPALVSMPVSGAPSAVTSVESPTDDPSDDTVEACE
jgi:hypothetical protein